MKTPYPYIRDWNKGLALYTEVSSFQDREIPQYTEVSSFQGVETEEFHCIPRFLISLGWNRQVFSFQEAGIKEFFFHGVKIMGFHSEVSVF